MNDDEIDFDLAKPSKAQEVINHFKSGPVGEDALDVGKLEYKELCEELLAEYHGVSEKLKAMEDVKEMLRRNVLKLMGREEGATRGKYAVFVKSQERKGDVDYKRLLQDREITEEILGQYRKPSTTYQKLEVKRLS